MESDRDISGAMVVDRDGKVLYATDKAARDCLRPIRSRSALEAAEPMMQEYTDASGTSMKRSSRSWVLTARRWGIADRAEGERREPAIRACSCGRDGGDRGFLARNILVTCL